MAQGGAAPDGRANYSGKIGVKFHFEDDRKENVDPGTCPIRVLFEHQELYRVALMSFIQRSQNYIKFFELKDKGTIDTANDLNILQPSHKLAAYKEIMRHTLQRGLERCTFDNAIYGYILQFNPDIEQYLMNVASQKLDEINEERERERLGRPIEFERSFWRRLSKNTQRILHHFCERKFYNGPAIQASTAWMDMAILMNQFSRQYLNVDFRQTAEPLGGSAHGSNYNTRVAYMTAHGHMENGDYEWAIDENFDYYDDPVFEMMETYLKNGKSCPSITFTHDFGATYAGLMTMVGECKSRSVASEDLKIILGCCRILNYSRKAIGLMISDSLVKVYRLTRREEEGSIYLETLKYRYCDRAPPRRIHGQTVRPPKNRMNYLNGVETVIHTLAQLLNEMEPHVDGITEYAGPWDFAAATDINWRPSGPVEDKYYDFYKGREIMHTYPHELQNAVQEGFEKHLQAQASEDPFLNEDMDEDEGSELVRPSMDTTPAAQSTGNAPTAAAIPTSTVAGPAPFSSFAGAVASTSTARVPGPAPSASIAGPVASTSTARVPGPAPSASIPGPVGTTSKGTATGAPVGDQQPDVFGQYRMPGADQDDFPVDDTDIYYAQNVDDDDDDDDL